MLKRRRRRRKNHSTVQMGQPGRTVFDRVRADRLRLTRANWRLIMGFTSIWLAAAALTAIVLRVTMNPAAAWFSLGIYVAGYVGMLGFFYALLGLVTRRMGGVAEQRTADLLIRLSGPRWRIFHHLVFSYGTGEVDVDHVLVGSNRILAIETKWTAWPHQRHPSGQIQGLSDSWINAAKRSAKHVSQVLQDAGVDVTVKPILIVWGPGIPRLSHGWFQVGTVVVWAGDDADPWMRILEEQPGPAAVPPAASEALRAHMETQV